MSPRSQEARAKVNLALHVTGRREDGYHLLDSFVVFPDIGDCIAARPGDGLSLALSGPFASALDAGDDNLVLRAAHLLAEKARGDGHGVAGAALVLDKQLPVASGIGGGSADAAAALLLLTGLWGLPYGADDLADIAIALGADVPMCLAGTPLRASGIGEVLTPLPPLPDFSLVLVNPGVAVSTPAVFRALASRDNPPLPALPAAFADVDALAAYLAGCRNDLEAPALAVAPRIGDVLGALRATTGCLLARMSGSGATCFGLFADADAAATAAADLAAAQPAWWVRSGRVAARTSSWCG